MAIVTLGGYPNLSQIAILYAPNAQLNGTSGVGWNATMSFKVPQAYLADFVTYAAGRSYPVSFGGAIVNRYIPMSHPDYPALLCTDIKSAGTGVQDPLGHFAWNRVTLTFTSVPYPTDGSQPFQTTEIDYAGKAYSLANTSFTFSDGSPMAINAVLDVPEVNYVITLYQTSQLDDSVYASLAAAPINSTTFLNWAPGYVKLLGVKATIAQQAVYSTAYTKVISCCYRPYPWNQFLRADHVWDTPLDPYSNPAYNSSDLNVLLQ